MGASLTAASTTVPNLVHVTDDQPGWTRRRRGRGFSYHREDGSLIRDALIRNRIKSLAIPPAWEDVWICPMENGHLLSTGRDEAGRKQYRYHPDWLAYQQMGKFRNLVTFAERLPEVRRRLRGILTDKANGWSRRRVTALAIALMDETGMRVGNSSYHKRNGTVGLTTLRRKHVDVDDDGLHFEYTGKSSIERSVDLVDPALTRLVQDVSELPGYRIFRFRDTDSKLQDLDSRDINELVHELFDDEVSSKYFRTWAGTAAAVSSYWDLLEENDGELPERHDLRVIERTAEYLGNTVAVCRKYYIHPGVMAAVIDGTVPSAGSITKREERRFDGEFDPEEVMAYRLCTAE